MSKRRSPLGSMTFGRSFFLSPYKTTHMFHNQILELQSQIHYHQQQIEETEQELYQLKAFQSYGDEAFNCVQEAISHIDGKYLDLFKESLLSLFDNPHPINAVHFVPERSAKEEDDDIEYMDDSDPNYQSIEDIEKEEPNNIVVYPYSVEDNDEFLVKLSDNAVYETDIECLYIGFKIPADGYDWANELCVIQGLSDRYWYEEPDYLKDYNKELKIKGITLEKAKHLVETYDFTKPPKTVITPPPRPDFTPPTYTDITPDIVYSSEGKCYIGFSSRARASTYGQLLKEVYEFTTTYKVDKPIIMHSHKWELKIWCSKDNAVRLAPLNLKKELDHPDNQVVTKTWVQKEVPSSFEDKSYPPISLTEVEVGDLVSRSSKGESRFKVLETREEGDGELYALTECLVNPIFPSSVGQKFSLKEIFLVEKCEDKEEF